MKNSIIYLGTIVSVLFLSACTTVNVDHIKTQSSFAIQKGDSLVILGRRHSHEEETEHSLVSCIGKRFMQSARGINVVSEARFMDEFYPWFEARTAPLHPKKLKIILDDPIVDNKMESLRIRYFVWVDGSTKRTDSAGSMACSVTPAGGGCFGFGMWEDTSNYEASVWDVKNDKEVGRISTEAVGTSYMPAFVIPVPLLAGVEKDACVGMSNQLVQLFADKVQ